MSLSSTLKEQIPNITSEELHFFLNRWTKEVTLKRNDFLVKKGAIHPYLYFVEKGALHIYYPASEKDLAIRFGYKNNFIGIFPSFINNQPTHFTVQALKASKVLGIHRDDYYEAIGKSETLTRYWQNALEFLVISQLEREIDLLTASPAERYQRVLERSPQLFQEIPLKHIAAYLRMTPETLSRLRKS
jgi:CRP-like cAMP-binding protein